MRLRCPDILAATAPDKFLGRSLIGGLVMAGLVVLVAEGDWLVSSSSNHIFNILLVS